MFIFFLLFLFLFFSSFSSQYCDNCPLKCCNKYGACASYSFQCSCSFETSYQISSGFKCENCCSNYRCVNDNGSDICETVKSIQQAGKIIGLVIGITCTTCFVCFIIILCVKRKKRRNLLVHNTNNNISSNVVRNGNENQEGVAGGIPVTSENLPPLSDQMMGVPIYDESKGQNQYPNQINNYGGYINYPTNVIPMPYPPLPNNGGVYNQIPQNYYPNSGNSNNNMYPPDSGNYSQNNGFTYNFVSPDSAQNNNAYENVNNLNKK